MKTIAITPRLISNPDYFEIREGLDINWGALFKSLDFLPLILPIEIDFEEYFRRFKIDGIVLTGGNDLASVNANKLSLKRDAFEKKLIAYALEQDIPILGLCRGMQVIAEYFDLELEKVENQVAVRHKIKVNENSQYYNELKKIDEVNAFHNYGVKSVNDDFIVSATNESGLIKAIEHKKYKVFAQMWHSEREEPFNKNEMKLVKKFFGE